MDSLYSPSPLMAGVNKFVQLEGERTQRNQQMREQSIQLNEKEKKQLSEQFMADIQSATAVLKNAKDPEQRKAVQSALEQMRQVYTGSLAKQYGLDGYFSRQIDFALQTPVEEKSGSSGSSSFERLIESLPPDQQGDLKRQRAATLARGGSDPYNTAMQKEQGKQNAGQMVDLNSTLSDIDIEMARLDALEQNILKLGPYRQGVGRDYLPDASSEAKGVTLAATEGALKYVQQTKGAISNAEMALFKGASINTGNTMEYNLSLATALRAALVRSKQMALFKNMWLEKYGTLTGADVAFAQFANDNKIIEAKDGLFSLTRPLDEIVNDESWVDYLNAADGGAQDQVIAPISEDMLMSGATPNAPATPPPPPGFEMQKPKPVQATKAVAKRKVYNPSTGKVEEK